MSPKVLARVEGVVAVRTFLTSSLITMRNLVALSHTVCAERGGPTVYTADSTMTLLGQPHVIWRPVDQLGN